MTFPAWFAFHRDPALRRQVVAHTVYSELLLRPGSLSIPVEVKGWAWALTLGVSRPNLVRALNILVAGGYLIEHPRAGRGPRRFTVALALPENGVV